MGASLDAIYAEVLRLNEKLEALPSQIEILSGQVKIVSLDELSETLGLIKAGEFRSGNLRAPGDSFSGVRIGYPGFQYPGTSTISSDLYNIVGVDADTLQFGIRASDGIAVFGAGGVELNALGIEFRTEFGLGGQRMSWYGSDGSLRSYLQVLTPFESEWSQFGLNVGSVNSTDPPATLAQILFQASANDTVTGDSFRIEMELNESAGNEHWDISLLDTAGVETAYLTVDSAPGVWMDGVIRFGASDTTNLDLGYLNEKALTFASTATAGIEDPDNEMGKLWLDTDFEMRLTDTAGEDWYVTKSTSTGNRSNILFLRTVAEETTDDAIAAGWQSIFGSDTGTIFRTGEITFAANTAIRVSAQAKLNYSVAQGLVAISASVWDTAGVLLFQRYSQGYNGAAADDFFSFFTNLDYYYDSGLLVPATAYLFGLQSYGDVASNRTYLADNQLVVTEVTRGWTVTT